VAQKSQLNLTKSNAMNAEHQADQKQQMISSERWKMSEAIVFLGWCFGLYTIIKDVSEYGFKSLYGIALILWILILILTVPLVLISWGIL